MSDNLPEPVFLSAPKAATLCGVSRNTVCCWIREGKLPSYRTAGGKNLIRPGDLVSFMRKHSMFVPQSLEEMASVDANTMGEESDETPTSLEPGILVVDDDAGARAMAVRCLTKVGLPIFEAETGFEALHILTQHPEMALVVLDLVMPGQHGADTLREIRKQHDKLPVIVVTGYAAEGNDKLFGELGPDLIMTKPYEPKDLIQAAQAFLSDLGL
jgi:excisionase family DNA binding protein